jgi:hypothetical protein
MTVGPSDDDTPAWRGAFLARRLSHVPVGAAIAAARNQALERAVPATRHHSGRGAGARVARKRMREFMDRPGGRGVTVTMIVNRLASDQLEVTRGTVRRWLADDINRGVAERVTPGFYRLCLRGDPGRRPGGRRPR